MTTDLTSMPPTINAADDDDGNNKINSQEDFGLPLKVDNHDPHPRRQQQHRRYTDELRLAAGDQWTRVVNHRFTTELAAGTIDYNNVLIPYLIQDHRFLDSFSVLLASVIASLPTLQQRIPLCQFLGVITGPENTYFERAFKALDVTEEQRSQIPNAEVTTKFCCLMREVAIGQGHDTAGRGGTGTVNILGSSTLAEKLAVLVVCEWSYLSWGQRVVNVESDDRPVTVQRNDFVCYEWIDLHSGPEFEEIVDYMRQLLDEEGRKMKEENDIVGLQACHRRFMEVVNLEEEFFDYAYNNSNNNKYNG
jgi:thiaminase (transcriptional activator TenA)